MIKWCDALQYYLYYSIDDDDNEDDDGYVDNSPNNSTTTVTYLFPYCEVEEDAESGSTVR